MGTLAEWFVWLIAVAATIYLLTESMVGRIWRFMIARFGGDTFVVLAYCRACTGWWVGLAYAQLFPHVACPNARYGRFLLSAATSMMLGYVWSKLASNDAYEAEKSVLLAILRGREA